MKTKKNLLEWIVFGVSAALIVAVLAILVAAGRQSDDRPPHLVVDVGPASRAGNAYRLPVRVRNEGDQTAEQGRIEVVLASGERIVERSELTLAFIPRKSSREGWVTFGRDPSCCTVVARAVGFNKP